MLTKLGRDEVIMALHMRLGFPARSAKRWIQGSGKIGQWGAPCPKDFFIRLECNSNKLNASLFPELKYRDCLLFGLISQIWQSCFLINDLLRNLTFIRSAHCTQVSDQCPLGLLFKYAIVHFQKISFILDVIQKCKFACSAFNYFMSSEVIIYIL